MVNGNRTAEVNVMSAKFKTDTGVYSDQDPYIRFVYNDLKFKTTTKKNSGAAVEWNEVFKLGSMRSPNTLRFTAMGKTASADEFIGESQVVDLTQVSVGRSAFSVQLYDKDNVDQGTLELGISIEEEYDDTYSDAASDSMADTSQKESPSSGTFRSSSKSDTDQSSSMNKKMNKQLKRKVANQKVQNSRVNNALK